MLNERPNLLTETTAIIVPAQSSSEPTMACHKGLTSRDRKQVEEEGSEEGHRSRPSTVSFFNRTAASHQEDAFKATKITISDLAHTIAQK